MRDNIFNILRQVSIVGIISVGMTLVMLTGGIDLSCGSIVGAAAVGAALLMTKLSAETRFSLAIEPNPAAAMTRLNAIKQVIGLVSGVTAAVFFIFNGLIIWPVALVMMAGSLIGGVLGGKFAGMVNPTVLRWIVVVIGVVLAVIYFLK